MTLPVRPVLAAVVLACCLSCGPVLAAEGDPDSTFWSDGTVFFGGSGSYYAHGLVTAPDGRLVVVGTYTTPSVEDFWFWKAVGDGASSTSGTCFFTPPGGATSGFANAAAFDLGGQLLVAGSADYGGERLAVARFAYPDCTLDDAFDGDGYWTLDVPGGDEYVMAIAVNPLTGKIALGGVWDSGSVRTGVVAVLSDSGVLDAGFSGNGWRNLDPSGTQFDDFVAGIAFGEGGRVIVAGSPSTVPTATTATGSSPRSPLPACSTPASRATGWRASPSISAAPTTTSSTAWRGWSCPDSVDSLRLSLIRPAVGL